MPKDQSKRFVVALNFDTEIKERLKYVCERESRSPTQQIEFFVKKGLLSWWKEHKDEILSDIETTPSIKERFISAGILEMLSQTDIKKYSSLKKIRSAG